jgi:hypothetical protein
VSGTDNHDLRYRSGYLASRTPAPPQGYLQGNPLNATAIGLTALVAPDPLRPGKLKIDLTVDLQDLRMSRSRTMWTGAIDLSLVDPASGAGRSDGQSDRSNRIAAPWSDRQPNQRSVTPPGKEIALRA